MAQASRVRLRDEARLTGQGGSLISSLMSILPIIILPDPLLRQRSAPVERVDEDLQRLVDDMLETMYDAPGVGLAAVQVAVPRRLIVVDVSSGQKFVWPGSGVPSKADIHSFVTSVVAGAATGVGLKAAV